MSLSAYRELEPALLSRLNAEKRAEILKQRFRMFQTAFPSIISPAELAALALSVPPRRIDIVLIPAVRTLLEEEGESPLSAANLVETLRPIMPALSESWVEEVIAQINEHVRERLNEGEDATDENAMDDNQPTELAVAYMTCPQECGVAGHLPKLLKHSCGHPSRHCLYKPTGYNNISQSGPETYESLAENFFREKCFTPTVLHLRKKRLEAVVKAYGRDPKTTTLKEMTAEPRLVRCELCVERAKNARLGPNNVDSLDWLAAVRVVFFKWRACF